MKNLLKSIAAVLVFGAIWASCNTDPCKNKDCGANGTCNTLGTCICDACFSLDANGQCTVAKDCGAHGTCNTSSEACDCETGYEADTAGKCETKWSAKFLGNYNGSDQCNVAGGPFGYASTASESSASAISMSNSGGWNNPMTINLSSSTDGTVSGTDAGGRVFEGSGSMNSSNTVFNLSYIVTFTDGTKDTRTSVYTKQ